MATKNQLTKTNPFLNANILSKLFFCWMNKFFHQGNQGELKLGDIYTVLPNDSSEYLGNLLSQSWKIELDKAENSKTDSLKDNRNPISNTKPYVPSLGKAIVRVFFGSYMLYGILACIEECVTRIMQPILLGYLLRYFASGEYSQLYGYLLACGVVGTAFLFILTHHPFFYGVQHAGMRIRVACSTLIYRKALRLSQVALGNTTAGQMVNLLSNDVNRFDQSTIFLHYLWIGPLQTIIITVILWNFFGPSCLVGVVILLLFVPFQGYMGRLFSIMRSRTAAKTDSRIRIMNEIVSGIRVIKMYTWEKPFAALVHETRKNEVDVIRKTNFLRALNMSLFLTSSKIIVFLTFLVHVSLGESLTSEKVFVTLTLYNNVRLVMMLFFPNGVSQLAETLVSIKRLEKFLLLEEKPEAPQSNINLNPCNGIISSEVGLEKTKKIKGPAVKISNFNAKWDFKYDENTLSNINLNVESGSLVAVIGPVGSGKSSLLNAILKELPPVTTETDTPSSCFVQGKIGYASQEAWIFNASVRENIVFNNNFDEAWYNEVVDACALRRDIALLPYGDNTPVNAGTLSGGQRARINLARAVYAQADVYLIDDPLAAVDAKVSRELFENCICGLLKLKTRILITHQLQLLKSVDYIVVLENGRIIGQGTYDELMAKGIDLAKFADTDATKDKDAQVENEKLPKRKRSRQRTVSDGEISIVSKYSLARVESVALGESTLLGHLCSHEEIYHSAEEDATEINRNLKKNDNRSESLVEENVQFLPKSNDEVQSSGTVKWSLYWKYFRAGSTSFTFGLLLFTNLIAQICFTGSDYWLSLWTTYEEHLSFNSQHIHTIPMNLSNETRVIAAIMSDEPLDSQGYWIIYAGIVLIFSIFSMIRTLLFFKISMDASVNLHNQMFQSIIRVPMRFFETNPIGRILNRFTKDMGQMDDALPQTFFDAAIIFISVLGILGIISYINPILIVPALILGIILNYFRNYYLKTARSVKRLEGTARSPVFSHLSTTLHGLTTIRAFHAEEQLTKQFDEHHDLHSSTWFVFVCTTRWFGIRLDLISLMFISCVTFSCMFTVSPGAESAYVGLTISSALLLSGMLQWGVRQSAEVENQMVSVERVMDYTKLKPEKNLESSDGIKPSEVWPSNGEISFKNINVKYDEEIILKNITFQTRRYEKIGICGRTGSGKSSLISTLFRIVEPCSGEIWIDGINVLGIGLHELRGNISIIPQEPVLFNGTVRKNLDPFDYYTDDKIWEALENVHLNETVKEIPSGLYGQISEGGSNFSLGERQLICLARALLRKNKILVLDEATASVDPETDSLIQETIRTKFEDCTVLTIAHRLHTIMDSDRIILLDKGELKEFDEPYNLMKEKSSLFYQLVSETGTVATKNLMQIAKMAHETRSQ